MRQNKLSLAVQSLPSAQEKTPQFSKSTPAWVQLGSSTVAAPTGMGLSPPSLVAARETQSPQVTTLKCFTSNTNTNSQPEALKFNCQGQLDSGKGLTLRIWRREHCKLSGAEEKDTSQGFFMHLKVSQTLLCQAWPAWPTKPGLQPTGHPWGQPGPQFQGPALPSPRFWEGAEPCHVGAPHLRGPMWRWDRRTQVPEHSPWLRAGCCCCCWSSLQPMNR